MGRRWRAQALAFAVRHLRQYARSPVSLLFLVAWPAFWYLLVARLLFDAASADGATVSSAKAAFAVSFGLFGALTVSLTGVVGAFAADVASKRYRTFRSLGVAPSADLAGRFLAGAALSTAAYVGLLGIGAADGAAFALRSPWSPAVVVLSLLAFVAVGVAAAVAIAAAVPRPEHASALATGLLLGVFFGTGFDGVSPALFPGPPWALNLVPLSLITRLQVAHLVIPAGADAAAFAPPALPAGHAATLVALAYGVGALFVGTGMLARAVYAGEAGE